MRFSKKRIFYICICICILIVTYINGCSDYKKISYDDLPESVKVTFDSIYSKKYKNSMAPFVECKNIDLNCKCDAKGKYNNLITLFLPQQTTIKTCNNKFHISWDYLERVYVVDGNYIYFPNVHVENGGLSTLEYGEPRSKYLKIDTLTFIKLKNYW